MLSRVSVKNLLLQLFQMMNKISSENFLNHYNYNYKSMKFYDVALLAAHHLSRRVFVY